MNVSSVKPAACASCDSAASSPFTRATQATSLDEGTALPHARHHAFDHRRQQQHDGAADRSVPEYLQEQARERFQVAGVVLAGQLAGEIAADEIGRASC